MGGRDSRLAGPAAREHMVEYHQRNLGFHCALYVRYLLSSFKVCEIRDIASANGTRDRAITDAASALSTTVEAIPSCPCGNPDGCTLHLVENCALLNDARRAAGIRPSGIQADKLVADGKCRKRLLKLSECVLEFCLNLRNAEDEYVASFLSQACLPDADHIL